MEDIRQLEQKWQLPEVEYSHSSEQAAEVILDIRSPEEEEAAPLKVTHTPVQILPFFKLASQFSALDPSKTYLLYCDRGVMSRLQAIHLKEQGFDNVKVYLPQA